MDRLRYNKFLKEKLSEFDNILNNCGSQLTQVKNNFYANSSKIFDCVQDYSNDLFDSGYIFSESEEHTYTLFDEACFKLDNYFDKLIEEIYKFSGRIFYNREELLKK